MGSTSDLFKVNEMVLCRKSNGVDMVSHEGRIVTIYPPNKCGRNATKYKVWSSTFGEPPVEIFTIENIFKDTEMNRRILFPKKCEFPELTRWQLLKRIKELDEEFRVSVDDLDVKPDRALVKSTKANISKNLSGTARGRKKRQAPPGFPEKKHNYKADKVFKRTLERISSMLDESFDEMPQLNLTDKSSMSRIIEIPRPPTLIPPPPPKPEVVTYSRNELILCRIPDEMYGTVYEGKVIYTVSPPTCEPGSGCYKVWSPQWGEPRERILTLSDMFKDTAENRETMKYRNLAAEFYSQKDPKHEQITSGIIQPPETAAVLQTDVSSAAKGKSSNGKTNIYCDVVVGVPPKNAQILNKKAVSISRGAIAKYSTGPSITPLVFVPTNKSQGSTNLAETLKKTVNSMAASKTVQFALNTAKLLATPNAYLLRAGEKFQKKTTECVKSGSETSSAVSDEGSQGRNMQSSSEAAGASGFGGPKVSPADKSGKETDPKIIPNSPSVDSDIWTKERAAKQGGMTLLIITPREGEDGIEPQFKEYTIQPAPPDNSDIEENVVSQKFTTQIYTVIFGIFGKTDPSLDEFVDALKKSKPPKKIKVTRENFGEENEIMIRNLAVKEVSNILIDICSRERLTKEDAVALIKFIATIRKEPIRMVPSGEDSGPGEVDALKWQIELAMATCHLSELLQITKHLEKEIRLSKDNVTHVPSLDSKKREVLRGIKKFLSYMVGFYLKYPDILFNGIFYGLITFMRISYQIGTNEFHETMVLTMEYILENLVIVLMMNNE